MAVVDRWLSTLVLSHGVTEVARAYLRDTPGESDAFALRTLLAQRAADAGPDLSTVIRGDFAAPDTVAVNGWILSRTEARLAALRLLNG